MCFFPSNYDNDSDFIGKKILNDDDTHNLWCRLEDKPFPNKQIKLSNLCIWKSNNKKILSLINYNFISNKITK